MILIIGLQILKRMNNMEKVEVNKNNFFILYIYTFILSMFLLLTNDILFFNKIRVPLLIINGLVNIFVTYKNNKLLITPLNIFSCIWLIIIPICSFDYPIMRAMTNLEWKYVLFFNIAFCIGAILSVIFARKGKIEFSERKPLKKNVMLFNNMVLIISIICLIFLYILYGGIPIFADDANVSKNLFRSSSILSFLSYFGNISIFIALLNNSRVLKNKKYIFLIIIYMLLLIFSGERFFVTLLILQLLLIYSKDNINRKLKKYIIYALLLIFIIFVFILNFRGNASQKKRYFIDSGIYSGNVSALVNTEVMRYFGMQERVLTNTINLIPAGYTKGTLTFSPILKLIGKNPINIPDVQIYGYTSKSIITKLYCDFGNLWSVAVIILSFIINNLYIYYNKGRNIFYVYNYTIYMMILIFSFYAYIDNFIILFLHFPIYVLIIQFLNSIRRT